MKTPYEKYCAKAVITMSETELLTLLFKLDRPDSTKSLIRRGEDGEDYCVTAVSDEEAYKELAVPAIHVLDKLKVNAFLRFKKEYDKDKEMANSIAEILSAVNAFAPPVNQDELPH
jgi:hypothetical protein